jgi:hypothetical protein
MPHTPFKKGYELNTVKCGAALAAISLSYSVSLVIRKVHDFHGAELRDEKQWPNYA